MSATGELAAHVLRAIAARVQLSDALHELERAGIRLSFTTQVQALEGAESNEQEARDADAA